MCAPEVRIFAFHKPRGILCSKVSEGGAATVFELLPPPYGDWYAIGRLDKDSEGLLLFCNNSRVAQELMNPGRLPKTYLVTVKGFPAEEDLDTFRSGGLAIDGRATRPAQVCRLGKAPRGGTRYRVVLQEGLNRQIRRQFQAAGFKVRGLKRTAFGPLELGNLAPGQGRELQGEELQSLLRPLPGRRLEA